MSPTSTTNISSVIFMTLRATINLRVLAGVAKPNPKMGQSLGPLGINMMQFCKVLIWGRRSSTRRHPTSSPTSC